MGAGMAMMVALLAVPQAGNAQTPEAQMKEAVRAAAEANQRATGASRQMESENAELEKLINTPPPPPPSNAGATPREGLSAAHSANQAGQRCLVEQLRLDGELARATATLLPNENIERLAILRTYSLKLRDAWTPCNEARANMYAKLASDALQTCKGIASDPGPCEGVEALNSSRRRRETAAALQQLNEKISSAVEQRQGRQGGTQEASRNGARGPTSKCPPGYGETLHGCHKGAVQ